MDIELVETLKLIIDRYDGHTQGSVFIPLQDFPWYNERNGQLTRLQEEGMITKPFYSDNGAQITLTKAGREYFSGILFAAAGKPMICPVCGMRAKVVQTDAARSWAEIDCENCLTYAMKKDALIKTAESDLPLLSGYYRHAHHEPMTIQCDSQETVQEHVDKTRGRVNRDYQIKMLVSYYYQRMKNFDDRILFDDLPAIAYARDKDDLMNLAKEAVEKGYAVFDDEVITITKQGKEWLYTNTTGGTRKVRDEIFISHRSTDAPVADMIKDFLVNTGIPNEKIFCSSLPGNDVGEKISPEVKTHLRKATINILILTQSYYESAFCLNEAGVIWYLDDALALPIGLPEVDHTNMIGFLNSDYKLRRLGNADDIAYLYDEAKTRIGGQEIKLSVATRETQKLKERYQSYLKTREPETEDYIEPADAKHIVEIKAKIEAAIVDKSWVRTQEDRLKLLRDRPSRFKCNNLILKDASISNPDINNGLIKVEPYDFSDDGIVVVPMSGDMRKKVKVKGRGEIEVDVFSEVLFRDIEEIDPHGSQNYPYPTLFCRFRGKNPYNRDVYYDVAMGHVIDENQIEA